MSNSKDSTFKKIDPAALDCNFFNRIGTDWMLIAAEKDGQTNMMTASWGGVGVYWNKPVVYSYIRPQRYTKEFVDSADMFSLTFFPDGYREKLQFCGSKSGRDFDKVKECGFTLLHEQGVPYFQQANLVIIAKPLIRQTLDPACFVSKDLDGAVYPQKDYHDFYISEIIDVLIP